MQRYQSPSLPAFIFLVIQMVSTSICSANETFYAKPHAPIEMQYTIKNKININEVAILEIQISNTVDTSDLHLTLNSPSILHTGGMHARYDFGALSKNTTSRLSFEVSANQAGQFYIYLSTHIINNNQNQTRSFVIPVNIGNKITRQKATSTEIDSTGIRIISMPAKAVTPAEKN